MVLRKLKDINIAQLYFHLQPEDFVNEPSSLTVVFISSGMELDSCVYESVPTET